jgi:hypothetical protein
MPFEECRETIDRDMSSESIALAFGFPKEREMPGHPVSNGLQRITGTELIEEEVEQR